MRGILYKCRAKEEREEAESITLKNRRTTTQDVRHLGLGCSGREELKVTLQD